MATQKEQSLRLDLDLDDKAETEKNPHGSNIILMHGGMGGGSPQRKKNGGALKGSVPAALSILEGHTFDFEVEDEDDNLLGEDKPHVMALGQMREEARKLLAKAAKESPSPPRGLGRMDN
jgi:hypothetical protein